MRTLVPPTHGKPIKMMAGMTQSGLPSQSMTCVSFITPKRRKTVVSSPLVGSKMFLQMSVPTTPGATMGTSTSTRYTPCRRSDLTPKISSAMMSGTTMPMIRRGSMI